MHQTTGSGSQFRRTASDGWEKIGEFESREDAEKMRAGCLDFD